MTYRVEVRSGVSDYLRGLEGITREGRLALNGFLDALRNYGDEAREGCPRQSPDSTVFRLRWTFDAGPTIRSRDVYVDDSEGASGLLAVLYTASRRRIRFTLLSTRPFWPRCDLPGGTGGRLLGAPKNSYQRHPPRD